MNPTIKQKIQTILNNLDSVREQMVSLGDDIWLSIDHTDNESVSQGAAFKQEYNTTQTQFDELAVKLSVMVQQFSSIDLEEQVQTTAVGDTSEESQRIIAALDQEEKHYLDEKFTWKRPTAFQIEETAYTEIVTWLQVFQCTCQYLSEKSQTLFEEQCCNPMFISNRGNPTFSHEPTSLRKPIRVAEEIWAEGNYSAHSFLERIVELLSVFEIPQKQFVIYLREDRNA